MKNNYVKNAQKIAYNAYQWISVCHVETTFLLIKHNYVNLAVLTVKNVNQM
jgi:hypothetical protein